VVGYNYRMTNLQAAIGVAQLERIDEILTNRKFYEEVYKRILKNNIEIQFQKNNLRNRKKITWLTSVLLSTSFNKDEYIDKLKKNGIDARPFFYPLSDMKIYEQYSKRPTPITHEISKKGFNLPTYENLKSIQDIKNILNKLI